MKAYCHTPLAVPQPPPLECLKPSTRTTSIACDSRRDTVPLVGCPAMMPPAQHQQQPKGRQHNASRKRKRPQPSPNAQQHPQSKAARLETHASGRPQDGRSNVTKEYLPPDQRQPKARLAVSHPPKSQKQKPAQPSDTPSSSLPAIPPSAHTPNPTMTVTPTETSNTIHPPLPTHLLDLQAKNDLEIHDLTVISSSKIRLKVERILGLLSSRTSTTPHSSLHGDDEAAKAEGAEAAEEATRKAVEDGDDAENARRDVLVRLSAKSNVASKCVSVVEIMKRSWLASRVSAAESGGQGGGGVVTGSGAAAGDGEGEERGKRRELWQYNQLRGVKLPAAEVVKERVPKVSKEQKAQKAQNPLEAAIHNTQPAQTKSIIGQPNLTRKRSSAPSAINDPDSSAEAPKTRSRRRVTKKRTFTDAEGYLVTREEKGWESFSEPEGDDDEGAEIDGKEYGREHGDEGEEGLDDSGVTLPGATASTTVHDSSVDVVEVPDGDDEDDEVEVNDEDEDNDDDDDDAAFETLPTKAEREKDRERLALVAELQEGNEAKLQRARERPTSVLTVWLCSRRLPGSVVDGCGLCEQAVV